MTEIQGRIQSVRASSPTPAEALQTISRLKAEEVTRRWNEFPGKNTEGVASFQTQHGSARIGAMVHHKDPFGLDSVEVWLGPQEGPPASASSTRRSSFPTPGGT